MIDRIFWEILKLELRKKVLYISELFGDRIEKILLETFELFDTQIMKMTLEI